jgi:gliding motility-associated lipoprotein GldD
MKNKWIGLILLFLVGCSDYIPKPYGYPRIEYPEKVYKSADPLAPFTFDIPTYALLIPDTGANAEDYWYNLQFPKFNATFHLSYKPIQTAENLNGYIEDSRKLVFKHTIKAEEIEERSIADTSVDVYGMLYDLYGETATPLNLYLTDRNDHFVRGAFYFNARTEKDSILPVQKFLKKDIIHLIESFRWKD